MNVEEKINSIVERYWHEDKEYFSQFRYDENEKEFDMVKEIEEFLDSAKILHSVKFESGYSSCGYENDFLAIAWFSDDKIELRTVLLEIL